MLPCFWILSSPNFCDEFPSNWGYKSDICQLSMSAPDHILSRCLVCAKNGLLHLLFSIFVNLLLQLHFCLLHHSIHEEMIEIRSNFPLEMLQNLKSIGRCCCCHRCEFLLFSMFNLGFWRQKRSSQRIREVSAKKISKGKIAKWKMKTEDSTWLESEREAQLLP